MGSGRSDNSNQTWRAVAPSVRRANRLTRSRSASVMTTLIGHSGLAQAGYSGEVPALYLLRAAQGLGTGRLLMRAAARRLIAEGDRAMALWVLATNVPARRFYEHFEFEPSPVDPFQLLLLLNDLRRALQSSG